MTRALSAGSIIIAFVVSSISAYLFSKNQIRFETLIWIVIGALTIVIIMIYQEINSELFFQKLNQKKLDEKLKIYSRLSKIEERLNVHEQKK